MRCQLLFKQKSDAKNNGRYTRALAAATIVMAIFTGVLCYETWQMVEINRNLTNITEEYYRYYPPNVSVIYGTVLELYVFRNESCGTSITIAGLSQVYNGGIADDYGVVRLKYWGLSPETTIEEELNFRLLIEDTIVTLKGKRKIDAKLIVEASPYPIPIPAGGPPVEIPILVTLWTPEVLNLNSTTNLMIGKLPLEVIHPNTKEVISNVNALEYGNITYVIGEETANAQIMGRNINLIVRYTEDFYTFRVWRGDFLQRHGVTGVKLLADPCKK